MALVLQTWLSVTEDKLTVQEALSGVFGSVSLATWIFLLVSGVMSLEDIRGWG